MRTQEKAKKSQTGSTQITVRTIVLNRLDEFCKKHEFDHLRKMLNERFMLSLASRRIASISTDSHEAEAEMLIDLLEIIENIRELSPFGGDELK